MAFSFGDSFDLYAAPADAANGYWDSGATLGNFSLAAGRFTGSRALVSSGAAGSNLVKGSGANDAVHHLVLSYEQTAALSGTTLGGYLELLDGATAQCSIVFRSDGAILLTSGGPAGTTLATYANAFTAASTWYAFEFEVVINNTTGSFAVRRNGNSVADFTATGLDTQNSANAYANKLQIGTQAGITAQLFDDLFWRSDASSVAWLGDLRCLTRMPASDQSVQFSRTPPSITQAAGTVVSTAGVTAGQARYTAFTPLYDGTVSAGSFSMNTGYTGNLKCSIFNASGGVPTTVLASATTVVNPAAGVNALVFGSPPTVAKGAQYFIGFDSDTTSGTFNVISGNGFTSTTAYASFPAASPVTTAANGTVCSLTIAITTNNCLVGEAQQDGLTTYVYDSTPGDQDFYGVQQGSAFTTTPYSTVAVISRGYMQKSDAGTRTAAVKIKSNNLVPTTWNPADLSGVTLSGGNLVATVPSAGGVRAATPLSSGKYYFEYAYTVVNTNSLASGLALASASLGSPTTGSVLVLRVSGVINVNNAPSGSSLGGAIAPASVVGIAVDLTAKLIWFRIAPAGNWNGSGTANPATGVGGVDITSISTGSLYPLMTGASGDAITANFGAGAFTGAVPSGYTAGWQSGTTTIVATPTLTLSNSGFQWASRLDTTDPNTSAAWAAAAVDSLQVGPTVVA